MKRSDLLKQMDHWDGLGKRVFTTQDLRKIFREDSPLAFRNSIARISSEEKPMLQRVTKGTYVFAQSRRPWTHVLEEVARSLRRGYYAYLSLESALSEHGLISQVPVGHITVMTTGRSGVFETGMGTIEFTHTSREPGSFLRELLEVGRPLPLASADLALADLKRLDRNLHMLQSTEEEAPDAGFH